MLRREPYKDAVRTRDRYRLTEMGLDLYPVLMALREWGDRYMAEDGPPLEIRHTGLRRRADPRAALLEVRRGGRRPRRRGRPGSGRQGRGLEAAGLGRVPNRAARPRFRSHDTSLG